jgi:hypothetical protein
MKTPLLILAIAAGAALAVSPATAQEREMPTFEALDTNGDGQITMAELDAQKAARFADADTNGDGALSREELLARAADHADTRASRMVERMISRLDTNEDGILQEDEMSARGEDRIARRFERVDADDDGAISAEEFDAAAEDRGGRGGKKGKGLRRGHANGRG